MISNGLHLILIYKYYEILFIDCDPDLSFTLMLQWGFFFKTCIFCLVQAEHLSHICAELNMTEDIFVTLMKASRLGDVIEV